MAAPRSRPASSRACIGVHGAYVAGAAGPGGSPPTTIVLTVVLTDAQKAAVLARAEDKAHTDGALTCAHQSAAGKAAG